MEKQFSRGLMWFRRDLRVEDNAALYHALLADSGVTIPVALPFNRHVYHIYAIRVPEREKFQSALTAQGISTGIHYPIPVHLQPAYADLGYQVGDFPHSEAAADEVLSLPMFAELTALQQEVVARAVRKADRSIQETISFSNYRDELRPASAV